MADPTGITPPVAPVLDAVKWIARARETHKETDVILCRALERVLCPDAADSGGATDAALALRGRLYAAPDAQIGAGRLKRAWAGTKRVGRKLVHRVEREMMDGPRFEQELVDWIRRALTPDDLHSARAQLKAGCGGGPQTVAALAEDFPRALVSVLVDVRPQPKVAWEMLQRIKASDDAATWSREYLSRAERAKAAATAAVPVTATVAVAAEGVLDAHDLVTAGASLLAGLLSAVPALFSGKRAQRDARRDPARRAARRYARAWAADYLAARTGDRIPPRTAALRIGVAEAIERGVAPAGIGELHEDLAARIIPRARVAGEGILAEALEQLEDTVVRCVRADRFDGAVEAALLEVIAAAAEPGDAATRVISEHKAEATQVTEGPASVEQQQVHG